MKNGLVFGVVAALFAQVALADLVGGVAKPVVSGVETIQLAKKAVAGTIGEAELIARLGEKSGRTLFAALSVMPAFGKTDAANTLDWDGLAADSMKLSAETVVDNFKLAATGKGQGRFSTFYTVAHQNAAPTVGNEANYGASNTVQLTDPVAAFKSVAATGTVAAFQQALLAEYEGGSSLAEERINRIGRVIMANHETAATSCGAESRAACLQEGDLLALEWGNAGVDTAGDVAEQFLTQRLLKNFPGESEPGEVEHDGYVFRRGGRNGVARINAPEMSVVRSCMYTGHPGAVVSGK